MTAITIQGWVLTTNHYFLLICMVTHLSSVPVLILRFNYEEKCTVLRPKSCVCVRTLLQVYEGVES
jgi:hypothetical protein